MTTDLAASRGVLDVLDGNRVRRHTVLSVDRAVRQAPRHPLDALRKPMVAVQALRDLAAAEQAERRIRG
jgi:hypothetical protein